MISQLVSRSSRLFTTRSMHLSARMMSDSSSGKAGSIREAGGAMGKKGAAQEEQYFNKQNLDMKNKLKEHLKDEIKKHEEAIKASKELMKEIEK